jgi:hypothetical protein
MSWMDYHHTFGDGFWCFLATQPHDALKSLSWLNQLITKAINSINHQGFIQSNSTGSIKAVFPCFAIISTIELFQDPEVPPLHRAAT